MQISAILYDTFCSNAKKTVKSKNGSKKLEKKGCNLQDL